jgi:predicted dehydrogenase
VRTPVTVGVVCDSSCAGGQLARAFDALPQAKLRWICEEGPRVTSIGYGPATSWTTDFDALLQDEDLDAIVFASGEAAAHGRTLSAVAADKHVLVDGPLAATSAEADELVAAASQRHLRVMAYMPALHRPGVLRLNRLIDRAALGEIFYVHAHRHVLRGDSDIDLLREAGAETLAVVLDMLGDEPVEAHAQSESYLGRSLPDVILARLGFATGIDVYVHLSCLEGEQVERISVVGSEATAVLDSSDPQHELSIYLNTPSPGVFDDFSVEQGGRIAFRLPVEDPIRQGCARFLASVRSRGDVPYGREASAALAVVEALERSSAGCGSTETIAPRQERQRANVIAFRSR